MYTWEWEIGDTTVSGLMLLKFKTKRGGDETEK